MRTPRKFPAALRQARADAKMSLRELGRRIYRSGEYVAALERGGIIPKRSVATAIAAAISTHAKHTQLVASRLKVHLVHDSREDAIAHAIDRWERT